jgi:hypothetical protein
LTLEEEEMLFAEMQMQGQSNGSGSHGQFTPRVLESRASALTTDTWDGNPPPLEGDWASLVDRGAGSISGSLSSPSLRERATRSGLSTSTSDRQLSPSTSDRSIGSPRTRHPTRPSTRLGPTKVALCPGRMASLAAKVGAMPTTSEQ